jgi:probable HAF family extracellular repeat protein
MKNAMVKYLYGLALWATSCAVCGAADWSIVDLGALPGATFTYATVINAAGQAAGTSGSASSFRPVIFSSGGAVEFGTLASGLSANVTGINDSGVIVGAIGPQNSEHAFVYTGGALTDLGTLGGAKSYAHGINKNGVIVGRATTAQGDTKAFIYDNGAMTPITQGDALAINDNGLVVGSYTPQFQTTFSYNNGNLQIFPGGIAYDVNNSGLMVGQSYFDSRNMVEATYYAGGSWHSMGSFGGDGGQAFAVNNRDQAVGDSNLASGAARAFLFSDGTMHPLSDLLPPDSDWDYLFRAYDINDRGQIVGVGRKDGAWHAFMMTPTMATFDLDITYSDPAASPLVAEGDGGSPPPEVAAHFVLQGIAGMPGTFRLDDVLSANVEFAGGVWTALDLASFQMTLGPGGLADILSLSYAFKPLITPSGAILSLRNDSCELHIDGTLPESGEKFSYFYPDSVQTLTVPEPSAIVLAILAFASVACMTMRRR